jgi:hypothetical protein
MRHRAGRKHAGADRGRNEDEAFPRQDRLDPPVDQLEAVVVTQNPDLTKTEPAAISVCPRSFARNLSMAPILGEMCVRRSARAR